VEGSTAISGDEKPYAMLAGERALNEHLQRAGKHGSAQLIGIGYQVTYDLPDPEPLVSIMIPTKDRLDMLERCVASIRHNTNYKRWEVLIVDNASIGADTKAYLSEIAKDPQFRVLGDPGDFNYSRLNNIAAKQAAGEFVLLLNNDVEAITPDWLREMVGVCSQEGVGAVGARLWYPDDTLQHGGVILGLGGLAAHAHTGIHRGMPGYAGRAILRHELSAVSAACMLTRRKAYVAVGGLDEADLKVAYNDVDYCLKLRAAGWKIVWTPFADLYHYESASRGYERSRAKQDRLEKEKIVIRKRWQSWLDRDPAYNPNLSLDDDRFSLGFPPRV
jgi:GT2 family glycosyltransferase